MDKRGPNPFGWNHYSPWLFYPMALIGSFMLLGILGILFTAPAALLGVIPAFLPIIVAVRQWHLKGKQGSSPKTQLDQVAQTNSAPRRLGKSASSGESESSETVTQLSQRKKAQAPTSTLNDPSFERLSLALAQIREQRLAGRISDVEYYDRRAKALESYNGSAD